MKFPAFARRAVLALAIFSALGLLSANLVVLLMILRRMPPTAGELKAAQDQAARRAIFDRVPMTRASVAGTVDVYVAGGDVNVN